MIIIKLQLVNHGIPEGLMKDAIAAAREFFDLPDSEKKQYESKLVLDSIQCGNLTLAICKYFKPKHHILERVSKAACPSRLPLPSPPSTPEVTSSSTSLYMECGMECGTMKLTIIP